MQVGLPALPALFLRSKAVNDQLTSLLTITTTITITIHFIHPSGKLKLLFDRTTKNISQ